MRFGIEVTGTGQFTRGEVQRILDYIVNLGLEEAQRVVESADSGQNDVTWAQQALGLNIHSPRIYTD